MRGRRRTVDHDQVRALAAEGGHTYAEIAAIAGGTARYVRLIAKGQCGVETNGLSRQASRPLAGRSASLPAFDNPALAEGRTLYPSTVGLPDRLPVLKSGASAAKIGRRIVKGKWKGFEVYTLTLEERATCPISCRHWRSCFGNGMQVATRMRHGAELERRISAEVRALAGKHPKGFAIRLHVLGDFYSTEYVAMWARLLKEVPQLHVFGFSARWDYRDDEIAHALIDLAGSNWKRFAIRFSNAPVDECSTVSIEHPFQNPADAIICPQQLGKTQACVTCALCWQTTRRIAFLQH